MSDFVGKYGSHFRESEAVLAATLGDMDFIETCLKDMALHELYNLRECIEVVSRMAEGQITLQEHLLDASIAAYEAELDYVIEVTQPGGS